MNNLMDDVSLDRVNLSSSEVAFAILKEDDSPNLGLYIPTLMSEINMGESIWERTENLNSGMLINKDRNFSFDSIKLCNYYMVEPYDPALYYTETELGEQVRIKFRDNDIKQCYYYDDTYKMTDCLMDEIIKLKEEIGLLNDNMSKIMKRVNSIEERMKTDDTE